MRIRSVESFVRGPIGLVRVRTTSGAEGIGQMAPFEADIVAMVLHRQIAPHALGADARDIRGVVDRCIEGERKFHGSHLMRALAGLDTALWDLRGRVEGLPVCDLLGRRRDVVAAYGSCTRRDVSIEELGGSLREARRAMGLGAFKFKIGHRPGAGGDRSPHSIAELVGGMRRMLGDDAALLVDANGGLSADEAITAGRTLEEHGVSLFEEPCAHWDLDATTRVARALALDVAGGEQEHSLDRFRLMLERRCVDAVQPDVCYLGGMTRAMEVARMAAEAGVPCMPHAGNRSLIAVFAVHLALAAPDPGAHVEFPLGRAPWDRGLYPPALVPVDGVIEAPTEPGWGVRIPRSWLVRARRRSRRSSRRLARAVAVDVREEALGPLGEELGVPADRACLGTEGTHSA